MTTSTRMRLIGTILATGAVIGVAPVAGSGVLRRHRRHAVGPPRHAAEGGYH